MFPVLCDLFWLSAAQAGTQNTVLNSEIVCSGVAAAELSPQPAEIAAVGAEVT